MPSFFRTALEIKQIAQRIRDDPSLGKALINLKKDLSEIDEYAEAQLRKKIDDFLTIQILGPQGSGKSGVGQALAARYATITFTADDVSLHYDGFLEGVETLENGQFSILDEQTKLYGTGSMRLRGDIVNIIETLRQNGGSIIIISPTEKMITTADVHIEIEVLSRDHDKVLCAWKARTDKFIGSFILTLDWESPVWIAYMKNKTAYVADAKKRRFHKNDFEKLAGEIRTHPDYQYATKKKELQLIAEKLYPNLTIDEKKLVLTQLELDKKKGF